MVKVVNQYVNILLGVRFDTFPQSEFSQVSAVAITGSVFAAMGVILLCIGSAIFVVNLRRRKHQAENKNRYISKLPEH